MDRHRFLAYCPFCELIAAAYAPHDRGGSSGSALLIGSIRLISISPSISQSSYLFAKIMFAKNIYRTTLSRRELPKRLRNYETPKDYTERLSNAIQKDQTPKCYPIRSRNTQADHPAIRSPSLRKTIKCWIKERFITQFHCSSIAVLLQFSYGSPSCLSLLAQLSVYSLDQIIILIKIISAYWSGLLVRLLSVKAESRPDVGQCESLPKNLHCTFTKDTDEEVRRARETLYKLQS